MPPEPIVLAFDCSAAHCAAALLSGERLLASVIEPMETGQAERLMPMLQAMLAGQGLGWRDLGGIGVGTGPGNFTGVRIAVSAARGLALGLGVPAVGVTVLEARAFGLPGVTVVEDARRGEVYLAAPGAAPRLVALAEVGPGGPVTGTAAEATGRMVVESPVPLAEAIARIAMARLAEFRTSGSGAFPALVGRDGERGSAPGPGAPPPSPSPTRGEGSAVHPTLAPASVVLPRPAPFYLRGPDAALPSEPPPVILP